jgi:hypothetical protein
MLVVLLSVKYLFTLVQSANNNNHTRAQSRQNGRNAHYKGKLRERQENNENITRKQAEVKP